MAQTNPVPGREDRQITQPAARPLPPPVQQEPENIGAPPGSDKIKLKLVKISLEGNTVFTSEDLSEIWASKIGQEISVADLYLFAYEITRRYSEAGYALSFAIVPEQEITGGKIVLKVVEGFVDKVVFEGDFGTPENPAPEIIVKMGRRIAASRPLKEKDLERYLMLINDMPGFEAQATFAASKETLNATTLRILLKHQRYGFETTVDNSLSSNLNYFSASFQPSLNIAHDLASANARVLKRCGTNCGIYSQLTESVTAMVHEDGWRVTATNSESRERSQRGTLASIDFLGSNQSSSVDVSYPLKRSRRSNIAVGSSFSRQDSRTTTFAGTLTRDKLRTASIYTSLDLTDRTGAVSGGTLRATQGLPLWDATEADDPERSRAGGVSNFTTLKFDIFRNQPLGGVFPELSPYSLYLSASMQKSFDPLLSGSQCYYGGESYGKGYEGSAISGDNCVMLSAELRRDWIYGRIYFQGFAFGDAGKIWRDPANVSFGETKENDASSYGMGLRSFIADRLTAELMSTWSGRDSIVNNGKGSQRNLFTLTWRY
jgi:hemolysin activation/secretion protein